MKGHDTLMRGTLHLPDLTTESYLNVKTVQSHQFREKIQHEIKRQVQLGIKQDYFYYYHLGGAQHRSPASSFPKGSKPVLELFFLFPSIMFQFQSIPCSDYRKINMNVHMLLLIYLSPNHTFSLLLKSVCSFHHIKLHICILGNLEFQTQNYKGVR